MRYIIKRVFDAHGMFWIILLCLVLYSCHPVPSHAAEKATATSNCISSTDGFGTNTTQCVDGTVTITSGSVVTVCSKGFNGDTTCQKL